MAEPILEAQNLSKRYPLRSHPLAPVRDWIHAVDRVNLTLAAGESVGLVGESGCGKSTLARMLCRLLPPSSGQVRFRGESLAHPSREQDRLFRRSVQMVFQDPMASLNPLQRVGECIAEPIRIHQGKRSSLQGRRGLHEKLSAHELQQRVAELLREVGLDPSYANRFPQALSGGQRQRVGIARALSLSPQLLLCDEPVSSLDLSVQAQILKLLTQLQVKRNLTIFLISHNLAAISAMCQRILVMKSGRIIEEGTNPALFHSPRDPYTQRLVNLALRGI